MFPTSLSSIRRYLRAGSPIAADTIITTFRRRSPAFHSDTRSMPTSTSAFELICPFATTFERASLRRAAYVLPPFVARCQHAKEPIRARLDYRDLRVTEKARQGGMRRDRRISLHPRHCLETIEREQSPVLGTEHATDCLINLSIHGATRPTAHSPLSTWQQKLAANTR